MLRGKSEHEMSENPERIGTRPEPDMKVELAKAVGEASRGYQILIASLLFIIAAALVVIAGLLLSSGLPSRG